MRSERTIGKIGAYAVAAQLVGVFGLVYLTRLYSPQEFGRFAIVLALSSIVAAGATLQLERDIPIEESDEAALNVAVAAFKAAVAAVVVVEVCVLVVMLTFGRNVIGDSLLFPLAAIPTTAFQVLNQLIVRKREYSMVANRPLIGAVARITFQGLLGAAGVGWLGLLFGFALGQATVVLFLALPTRVRGFRPSQTTSEVIRERSQLVRYLAPSSLMNVSSLQIPVIILASTFGQSGAGSFGLVQRAVQTPLGLASLAVGQFYLGELAALLRTGEEGARGLFLRLSGYLACFGLALALGATLVGPKLARSVLGGEWIEASMLVPAMGISVAAQALASPLASTLIVTRRYRLIFLINGIRIGLVVGTLLFGYHSGWTLTQTVWLFAAGNVVSYSIFWLGEYSCFGRASA